MEEEEKDRKKKKKKNKNDNDSPYRTQAAEITDWIPAFPIEEREFKAWITCAETGGIIYLRYVLFRIYPFHKKNGISL